MIKFRKVVYAEHEEEMEDSFDDLIESIEKYISQLEIIFGKRV